MYGGLNQPHDEAVPTAFNHQRYNALVDVFPMGEIVDAPYARQINAFWEALQTAVNLRNEYFYFGGREYSVGEATNILFRLRYPQ